MRRHLRLIGRFWATSLAAEMEYPLNMAIELVAVLGNLAGSLGVLALLFGPDPGRGLGGWSWDGALVVLGVYTLLEGLTSCVLQPNLSRIVGHVQNGTLDFVLLQPVDSQFWLSLRHCSPWGLPGLLAGLLLIGWGAVRAGTAWSPAGLLLAAVLLLAAAAILYSLWFLLAALSLWFVKVWNATEVLRTVLVAGRYPLRAYPPALRLVFTLVLPVAFLTSVPAEAILGRAAPLWAVGAVAFAGASLTASRLFWRQALRHYTSASS
ncbi:MAG: ABC transporter permease [Prochlorococcaceae cyanobacterium]